MELPFDPEGRVPVADEADDEILPRLFQTEVHRPCLPVKDPARGDPLDELRRGKMRCRDHLVFRGRCPRHGTQDQQNKKEQGRHDRASRQCVYGHGFLFFDGSVKSPYTALRCILRPCGLRQGRPHSSGFARLVSGAFYEVVSNSIVE